MSGPAADSGPDHWSADRYAGVARFVTDYGAPVLALLAPRPGERILDLGCGDAVLTAEIAASGAEVLGLDASPSMVAAAVARGVPAQVADGTALPGPEALGGAFDAVFSNAALHWMVRPDAVIAGVARLLRPGGRFVAEMGGHGNVAAIRTALIAVLDRRGVRNDLSGIWYFPSPAEQAGRLERAGFRVAEMALIPRPTPVLAGLEAWLATLAAPALALLPEAERKAAAAEVAALVAPALREASGRWVTDYVRLRFKAIREGAA